MIFCWKSLVPSFCLDIRSSKSGWLEELMSTPSVARATRAWSAEPFCTPIAVPLFCSSYAMPAPSSAAVTLPVWLGWMPVSRVS